MYLCDLLQKVSGFYNLYVTIPSSVSLSLRPAFPINISKGITGHNFDAYRPGSQVDFKDRLMGGKGRERRPPQHDCRFW